MADKKIQPHILHVANGCIPIEWDAAVRYLLLEPVLCAHFVRFML